MQNQLPNDDSLAQPLYVEPDTSAPQNTPQPQNNPAVPSSSSFDWSNMPPVVNPVSPSQATASNYPQTPQPEAPAVMAPDATIPDIDEQFSQSIPSSAPNTPTAVAPVPGYNIPTDIAAQAAAIQPDDPNWNTPSPAATPTANNTAAITVLQNALKSKEAREWLAEEITYISSDKGFVPEMYEQHFGEVVKEGLEELAK